MTPIITVDFIRARTDNRDYVVMLEKLWPDGMRITPDNIRQAAREGFPIAWLVDATLHGKALRWYENAAQPLWDEFHATTTRYRPLFPDCPHALSKRCLMPPRSECVPEAFAVATTKVSIATAELLIVALGKLNAGDFEDKPLDMVFYAGAMRQRR